MPTSCLPKQLSLGVLAAKVFLLETLLIFGHFRHVLAIFTLSCSQNFSCVRMFSALISYAFVLWHCKLDQVLALRQRQHSWNRSTIIVFWDLHRIWANRIRKEQLVFGFIGVCRGPLSCQIHFILKSALEHLFELLFQSIFVRVSFVFYLRLAKDVAWSLI